MRVVVVGASGAVGSAAARALARAGADVVGLDRHPPGHAHGSSHGAMRAIRQAYFEHPAYVPLARAAYDAWRAVEAEHGAQLLHTPGVLQIGPPDGEVVRGLRRAAAVHRLALEQVDGPVDGGRWTVGGAGAAGPESPRPGPHFPLPPDTIALLERVGGWVAVEDGVRALAGSAARAGADLRVGVTVHGWSAGVVHTSAGDVPADHVVVAPGAWAVDLLPELGLRVVRKVQHWFPSTRVGGPVFLHELPHGVFYGFPAQDGLVKCAEHTGGTTVDPDRIDRRVTPDDVARVAAFVRDHLPGVDPTPARSSVCMYTMSADGHFRIGRRERLTWAAGLSGHGFKFAPVLGRILADLVLDRQPAFDLQPFH